MRPKGSPVQLEARRLVAVPLLRQGQSLTSIARMLGCHPSSVMRWRDALEASGEAGLKAKPAPGRPPRLTRRQLDRLVRILLEGALARGYRTELWTTQRIADVIAKEFAVRYHIAATGRNQRVRKRGAGHGTVRRIGRGGLPERAGCARAWLASVNPIMDWVWYAQPHVFSAPRRDFAS